MSQLDPTEPDQISAAFNIAEALAKEIVYMNDEWCDYCSPEERWSRMRKWVQGKLKVEAK